MWLAAVGRKARRNKRRREEFGRASATQSDFVDTRWNAELPSKLGSCDGPDALFPIGMFLSELSLLRQRAALHCGTRADRAFRHFPHDPPDSVSAAAAPGAAAEVVIDLTHPQPLRRVRKGGPKLMVT